jgi:hypothetical protein
MRDAPSALIMPDLESTRVSTATPSVMELGTTSVFRKMYVQYAPNGTIATIQHTPVAMSLPAAASSFGQYLPTQEGDTTAALDAASVAIASIKMPQLFASAYCQWNLIRVNDTRPIAFLTSYLAPCDTQYGCSSNIGSEVIFNGIDTVNYTGIMRQELYNQNVQSPHGRIIWVENMEVSSPINDTALGAIVIQPWLCDGGLGGDDRVRYLAASACLVGARWANARLLSKPYPICSTTGLALLGILFPQQIPSASFHGHNP